ncbi:hypothetical protein PLICRDRAFT_95276 [Plicaturopsis crispa FD-325 SS-3]|uniref:Uncharacterized protein n=1 Tax=Plicaturopsis crispa FD-325 SS-3 TaxID=944288 RepID=A0A0C9T4R8_PLICR|nr:hypothetical protein PLICRDRAFT_95276 [Plicaturopsis crispa FD-325 SS-3]
MLADAQVPTTAAKRRAVHADRSVSTTANALVLAIADALFLAITNASVYTAVNIRPREPHRQSQMHTQAATPHAQTEIEASTTQVENFKPQNRERKPQIY